MKRAILTIMFLVVGVASSLAQYNTRKDSTTGINLCNSALSRREIVLPKVNGYNIYKADFHVHTIYSDGEVTPRERVREAWWDGLDIIALTDHLEIRTYEKFMLKALAPYSKDGRPFVYAHAGIANKKDKSAPVMSNLNAAYDEAVYYAKRELLPIMVVRGTEIWRNPSEVGEFNALFLTDINAICHEDLFESFRRAKEQGALIMHNHPGWRRKSMDIGNDIQLRAYDEGWVDGVEVVNDATLYPTTIRRCIERGLFIAANTDIHRPSSQYWGNDRDYFRTMTFVLANECTEEAIKEALKERRTIGYCGNHLVGEEKYLAAFLNGAVDCSVINEDKKTKERTFRLTNNCSIPFTLVRGTVVYRLKPFNSIVVKCGKDAKDGKLLLPKFTIENMWHIDEAHPTVELSID